MKTGKRRSLATTLRLSLLTGAGALGWMAVGASGASAADLPANAGLLGSVSDVVSSATAPVGTATDPLLAPAPASPAAGNAPALAGLVPQVSSIASQRLATVITPVAGHIDVTVDQLPVVQSILPPAPITRVTAPVIDTVDNLAGGVTQPVVGVVEPVLVPVVDVVVPVVEPVIALVVDVIDPALAPIAVPVVDIVVPDVATPVPAASPVAAPTPSQDVPGDTAASMLGSGAASPQVAASVKAPASAPAASTIAAPVLPSPSASDARVADVRAFAAAALSAGQGRIATAVDVAGFPALTSSVQALHDFQDISFASGALGALSSMTGAGAAAPLAALGAGLFLFVFLVRGSARRDAAAGLPSAPSFDPGSSPD